MATRSVNVPPTSIPTRTLTRFTLLPALPGDLHRARRRPVPPGTRASERSKCSAPRAALATGPGRARPRPVRREAPTEGAVAGGRRPADAALPLPQRLSRESVTNQIGWIAYPLMAGFRPA